MPATATAFPREKLLQIARTLPADLQVLSALGEMLQDINSELDEIAALLRRDVALASRIVRISNSPMFGGGGGIASVEDAVNRVGFGEILKLVGTATTARFSERALENYGISAQNLRDNMLYGALACEALARQAGADVRVAYTAGLLRPLGLMVIDRAGRGHLNWTERYVPSRWSTYSEWEGGMFGINNCEVTALILAEWRFPKELGDALRAQYLSRSADFDNQLACLLNVAGGLAHRENRGFVGEVSCWETQPAKLQGAGLTEDQLEDATTAANAAFDSAIAALAM